MKKALYLIPLLALILGLISPINACASAPLDEIENYIMTVSIRNDGTMDITYNIDWKVLDDESEGPLSWAKIGIPNSHVDEIKAISDNISDIGYMSDGGDYVRIDLDREYHADEIVSFKFSIHQAYMYTIDPNANTCSYSFAPGWFEGIDVKNLEINWVKTNVLSSDSQSSDDNNLIWKTSLTAGERYNVNVRYSADTFVLNASNQAEAGTTIYNGAQPASGTTIYTTDQSSYSSSSGGDASGIIIFIIVIVIIILAIRNSNNNYRGGFGTGHYYHGSHTVHSCACVSSCACACACACAGGGRAGCSAKDFYGAGIRTDKLDKILHNEIHK